MKYRYIILFSDTLVYYIGGLTKMFPCKNNLNKIRKLFGESRIRRELANIRNKPVKQKRPTRPSNLTCTV